jgi:DNA-binding beta-propeller fold protein YncE
MTRRDWLVSATFLTTAGCGRKKGTGYWGYAVIATSGDSSLSVVDLTAFRLVKTISLASPPTAVIAAPEGGASYVLTPANGTIYIVDAQLKTGANAKIADELSELRLTADGKRLIAIATQSRQLIEVDAATLRVLARQKLAEPPTSIDVSKNGDVAIASGERGRVELFNLASGRGARAQVDGRIGAVRFRSDGKLLLAANLGDRSLTVLTVPELARVADLQLAMQPENLCFTVPDYGQLFVSGEGMDAVAIVLPYRALEVEQTVLAGRGPGVMACSAAPRRYLFVGSHSGTDVSVLHVDSRKVIGLVEVEGRPGYIAITPDNQYALVLNENSGYLAVIHISAIRVNPAKTGAALFTMLPVGDRPVHAAVVPRQLG